MHRCLWPQTVQTRCKSRIIAEFSDASCLGSTPRASSRAETLSAHRRQALGAQRLHVLLCERGGAGDRPYTFKSLPSSESCADAGFTRVSQLLVFPTALQRPLVPIVSATDLDGRTDGLGSLEGNPAGGRAGGIPNLGRRCGLGIGWCTCRWSRAARSGEQRREHSGARRGHFAGKRNRLEFNQLPLKRNTPIVGGT